ncbi:MAG: hypothetical protein DRI84_07945 [Bacteroidetes bacterium]|nr:MAG: hypothetical protein DRI84_07945 [Bacteroidota bacterium]
MTDFHDIIEDVMFKLGTKKEFTVDVHDIDHITRNTIIDSIEDAGYTVDISYGEDVLRAYI